MSLSQAAAASRCERFSAFRQLTRPPHNRDGVSCRNVEKPSHLGAVVCPRKLHWILSAQKLRDL